MRVVYNGPFEAVEIASIGQIVERGVPVEVPEVVGQRLILQEPWSDPDAPAEPPAEEPVEQPPAEPEAPPTDEYDSWTMGQLRAVLTDRKLPVNGNQKVLIKRLRDAGPATDPDAPAEPVALEQTEES